MFRQILVWSPMLLLALLFVVGVVSGANLAPMAIAVLVGLQLLVVGAPKAAHRLGQMYGEQRG